MSRLHRTIVHAPRATQVDMTGRLAVVTGAAAGSIGGETARALSKWGAEVVTTTRTGGSCPLDLTDPASVRAFASWFTGSYGDRLDVLVNNAGVHLDLMSDWKQPHLTGDGHEVHWRTNYLGTAHLTSLLLPSLLATAGRRGQARVVNVVSKLHVRGTNAALFEAPPTYSSWDAYGTSKLALVHLTRELERRYADQGLHSYAVHPGSVLTHIADKGLAGHRLVGAVRRSLRVVEALVLMTAEEGAQTSLLAATQPDLEGGSYLSGCRTVPASVEADDRDVSRRLWEETQQWLGIP